MIENVIKRFTTGWYWQHHRRLKGQAKGLASNPGQRLSMEYNRTPNCSHLLLNLRNFELLVFQ